MSEREASEVCGATIRLLRALARRAGDGELEALEALVMLQDSIQLQLGAAVAGYREGPAEASWTAIAKILGTSRQAAHHRFKDANVGPAWPPSTCTCRAGHCDPLDCRHCATAAGMLAELCPKQLAAS